MFLVCLAACARVGDGVTWDTFADPADDTDADTSFDTAPDLTGDPVPDAPWDTSMDASPDPGADPDAGDPGTDPGGCSEILASFDYDFEDPAHCTAWAHDVWIGGTCGYFDSWQCGSITGWPENPPGSTTSLATDLDGWPENNECSYVYSPPVDLSPCAGETVTLEFDVAYSLEDGPSGCRDGGFVQVNGADTADSNWVLVNGGYDAICPRCSHLTGESAWCGFHRDWRTVSIDVSSYLRAAFQVRFVVEYDDGYPWTGLYVDNVRLTSGP